MSKPSCNKVSFVLFGWQLLAWPILLREFEFNAIWRAPVGRMIDIIAKDETMKGYCSLQSNKDYRLYRRI
jgi:hypothetical protein